MSDSRDLRFCVVGAGAAGISAADALRRAGYRAITVLEKDPERVGGKCRTVTVDGQVVDVGAIYVLPNYPVVEGLIRSTGVGVDRAARFVHVGVDGRRRPFGVPARPFPLSAKLAEYARLGVELVKYREILSRPLGEADPARVRDLSLPFARWVEERRLRFFHEVAYPLLRSFGFGFEEQEIPALYVFKIIPQLARGGNLATLWDPSTLTLDHVRGGYGELWRRVAAGLDVRLGVNIESIVRSEGGVRVRTGAGTLEFDRLILACPLDDALRFLDASAEEKRLFSRIRHIHVWQSSVRIDGIADALIVDRNQVHARLGHPMILFRYEPGSNLYYVFGYTTEAMADEVIAANVVEDIGALGGRIAGPPLIQRWRYFPHFGSADVAAGCLSAIEALQGQQSTWYVGELVSNIGVESVAAYARRLVAKTWG